MTALQAQSGGGGGKRRQAAPAAEAAGAATELAPAGHQLRTLMCQLASTSRLGDLTCSSTHAKAGTTQTGASMDLWRVGKAHKTVAGVNARCQLRAAASASARGGRAAGQPPCAGTPLTNISMNDLRSAAVQVEQAGGGIQSLHQGGASAGSRQCVSPVETKQYKPQAASAAQRPGEQPSCGRQSQARRQQAQRAHHGEASPPRQRRR
jgi:hypothetical protein